MPPSKPDRQSQLHDYAKTQLESADITKAQAFVNVIDLAARLVNGAEDPATA